MRNGYFIHPSFGVGMVFGFLDGQLQLTRIEMFVLPNALYCAMSAIKVRLGDDLDDYQEHILDPCQ